MNDQLNLDDFVPTRAVQLIKNNSQSDYKVINFEERKNVKTENRPEKLQKKQYGKRTPDETLSDADDGMFGNESMRNKAKKKKKNDSTEFDMKAARHEVMKFGLNGFKGSDDSKNKLKITRAVLLGAKPPKNEYKNYKELLKEKRSCKEKSAADLKFSQLGKNQTGAATTSCKAKFHKRKINQNELSKHYGVVNPKMQKRKRK